MKKKKNLFNVFYDKAADVLYISHGKPLSSDETSETEDEVVVRKDKNTGEIKGFTILHFLKRVATKTSHFSLPFSLTLR